RSTGRLPVRAVIGERTELAQPLRPHIVGAQLLKAERPAAVRHALAPLEVDRGERHEASAWAAEADPFGPAVRRAADAALAHLLQRLRPVPGDLATVQRLHSGLRGEAAAFEQADALTAALQLARQGDSRRTGAHNADVGLDRRIRGNGGCLDQHETARSAGVARRRRNRTLIAVLLPRPVGTGPRPRRFRTPAAE